MNCGEGVREDGMRIRCQSTRRAMSQLIIFMELANLHIHCQADHQSRLQEVSEKSEDLEGSRFRFMCSSPLEEQQEICPKAHERRLQKLMEARQEEDIKELQTSLEAANKSFHVYGGSEHLQSKINSNYQNRCYPFSK